MTSDPKMILSKAELGAIACELGDIGVANDDARFAAWAREYGPRLCFTAHAFGVALDPATRYLIEETGATP